MMYFFLGLALFLLLEDYNVTSQRGTTLDRYLRHSARYHAGQKVQRSVKNMGPSNTQGPNVAPELPRALIVRTPTKQSPNF